MPVRPAPTTYQCPACHWSKTVVPSSDALRLGEYFTACPVCQHASLVTRPASAVDSVLGRVISQVRHVLG